MTPAADAYHSWYYDSKIWMTTNWLGVSCQKSVQDLWNYQEILTALRPALIVEFGTYSGGSALYFSTVLRALHAPGAFRILTVDIDHTPLHLSVRAVPEIECMLASSGSIAVNQRISGLRTQFAGPVFFILDSDHHAVHVFEELVSLRDITRPGDYVVVEDGNINGHPVLPGWGDGPWEAIERYRKEFPHDYQRDESREAKFGWTFAPRGFLIRQATQ